MHRYLTQLSAGSMGASDGCPPPLHPPPSAILAINILSSSLGGYGAANVFAYHAFLMSVTFSLLIPLGSLLHRCDLGPLTAGLTTKADRTACHGAVQLLSALVGAVGMTIAIVYHESIGAGHIPLNKPTIQSPVARTLHVIVGYITISCLLIVAGAGLLTAHRPSPLLKRVHPVAGKLVWAGGLFCLAIAAWFEYMEKDYKPPGTTWTAATLGSVWGGLVLLVVAMGVTFRFTDKAALYLELGEGGEGGKEDSLLGF